MRLSPPSRLIPSTRPPWPSSRSCRSPRSSSSRSVRAAPRKEKCHESRISAHDTYTSGILGPTLIIGAGVALLFVTLSLVALNRVAEADSGVASSLLNTGQQVGGAIGLAVLGTVAWAAVAHNAVHATAAAARAGHPVHPGGPLAAAIYRHAIATGFSRAFLVAAGIALLTLAINITLIRVRRADLAGTEQPALAVALEPQ